MDELLEQVIIRVHTETTNEGVHYGSCRIMNDEHGRCDCLAAFDTGFLIGTISRLKKELEDEGMF